MELGKARGKQGVIISLVDKQLQLIFLKGMPYALIGLGSITFIDTTCFSI
jgi:hypothetical protein